MSSDVPQIPGANLEVIHAQSPALTAESLAQLEAQGRRSLTDYAIGAAAGVTALGVGYASWKYGLNIDAQQIVPNVPVISGVAQGINIASDTLTAVAPAVTAGALTAEAGAVIAGKHRREWRAVNEAAKGDFAGTGETKQPHRLGRARRFGRFIASTGLVATVLVVAAAGINREVAEGPTRAIDTTITALSPSNDNPMMVVQDESQQFMNNSYVSRAKADALIAQASAEGIMATPFLRELGDIRREDGSNITNLTLGVPTPLFTAMAGQAGAGEFSVTVDDCENVPILIDGDTRVDVGSSVHVHNQSAEVIGHVSGGSSMNRMAVVEQLEDVANCIQHNPDGDYYGVVVDAPAEKAQELFEAAGFSNEANLVSADQFRNFNKKFWQANGTPILLQMMLYIGGFSFIANRNERRADLQRNINELNTLHDGGVTYDKIRKIETVRALRDTTMVVVPTAVIAPVFAAAVNAAEWGLKVGIGAREVAVGFTLTLAAKLFGGRRAVTKMQKEAQAGQR